MKRQRRSPDAKAAKGTGGSARRPARAPLSPESRALLLATLAAALVLAFGVDERTLGRITDEQQLANTSVALAEFGELGVARGQTFAIHRPGGDAVAPYGVGAPLVFSLASRAAAPLELRHGLGASQSLYALLQSLVVLAAALAAGLLARLWSASPSGIAVAVVGTAIGSPLWAYASTLFAEPLVAASLAGALALAVAAGRAEGTRASSLAVGAGLLAGWAVLTKGLALALVPFLLLPLLLDAVRAPRLRLLAAAAGGLVPVLGAWLALEVARFGAPFTSYGGQGFTHPLADGLWRLTVGPNKGLLLYFPLTLLALAGLVLLARRPGARGSALAVVGTTSVLLLLTSAWWAWDGSAGWGPRLLVPLVPLLAAAAGVGAGRRLSGRLAWALVAAGIGLNSLGVLHTDARVEAYYGLAAPVAVDAATAASLPPGVRVRRADGETLVAATLMEATRADLSPFRVHAWLLAARLAPGACEERLLSPPWGEPKPRHASLLATPVPRPCAPFRWPRLLSALGERREVRAVEYGTVWADAVADQVLRATDTGRADRALSLAERLWTVSPSPYAAALVAESLRLAGRREGFAAFLRSLPPPALRSPSLGVVLALEARDRGDEARARAILRAAAEGVKKPALLRAADAPLEEWPRTLHEMTGANRDTPDLALPAVGPDASPAPHPRDDR